MIKNRNVGETLHDPKKMAIACGIIGMIVVASTSPPLLYRKRCR
jgi:hypothetical protein